jgi:small nuclear ribonucleoprotein (snRNP)-like protein
MAESYSHKFGQIIGDLLEVAIKPFLDDFAQRNRLFLDVKGNRELRGKGKKLTWTDKYHNTHDLDFVLERGGSTKVQGTPVAFIEAAWRRYTKHSRNKAQEIQGAILPLAEHHQRSLPFLGVILAGEFTEGALTQLRSSGFSVLYFTYQTVIEAFAAFDIDAAFTDKTPEADFREKVTGFYNLPDPSAIANQLVALNQEGVEIFLRDLEIAVKRRVAQIHVLPLYGSASIVSSIAEALTFVETYNEATGSNEFTRYEIIVRFNNDSEIIGKLSSKAEALEFLAVYA